MEEQPFDRIKVLDIVDRSGYSRSAFYAYYKDKHDLADRIIDGEARLAAELIRACRFNPNRPKAKLSMDDFTDNDRFLHVLEHVYDERRLYTLLFEGKYPAISVLGFAKKLRNMLAAADAERLRLVPEEDRNMPIEELFRYGECYGYISTVEYWKEKDFFHSPKAMAQLYGEFYSSRSTAYFDYSGTLSLKE